MTIKEGYFDEICYKSIKIGYDIDDNRKTTKLDINQYNKTWSLNKKQLKEKLKNDRELQRLHYRNHV